MYSRLGWYEVLRQRTGPGGDYGGLDRYSCGTAEEEDEKKNEEESSNMEQEQA